MKTRSTDNVFFDNYATFASAIQEKQSCKKISTLAESILKCPMPLSMTTVQLKKIKGQLNHLSPKTKTIQSVINRVLNHLSKEESKRPILKAESLLKEAEATTATSNDLIKISAQLKALDKSTTDGSAKESLKLIIGKVNDLIKAAPIAKPTATAPIAPKGIDNQGNDCFLIALYQLLRTKALTKHLVNRLPKELWEPLVANNPDAKFIRKAILDNTSLHKDNPNAMHSQLDATEVLAALFSRIDEPDKPAVQKPIPINTLRRAYENDFKDASNFLEKAELFVVFWMTTMYDLLTNRLSSMLALFGNSAALQAPEYIPHITVSRDRPPSNTPNPLTLYIKSNFKYLPEDTVPVKYRNHAHFGGSEHKGQQTDPAPYLPLSMEKTPKGIYQFEHILKNQFLPNGADDAGQLTVQYKKGPKIYKAPIKEKTIKLDQLPEFLLLSFKRAIKESGVDKKITDPIEGLDLEFTLPETLLEKSTPKNGRNYTLQSFVTHIGDSSGYGHYVSYRKEGDQWFYFNDASSKAVSAETAQEAAKQAYLVFYERKK